MCQPVVEFARLSHLVSWWWWCSKVMFHVFNRTMSCLRVAFVDRSTNLETKLVIYLASFPGNKKLMSAEKGVLQWRHVSEQYDEQIITMHVDSQRWKVQYILFPEEEGRGPKSLLMLHYTWIGMWFYELIRVIVNSVPLHTWIGMWFYEFIRVIVSAVPLHTWIGMWFYELIQVIVSAVPLHTWRCIWFYELSVSAALCGFYTLCFCIQSYLKVKLQYGFYELSWC